MSSSTTHPAPVQGETAVEALADVVRAVRRRVARGGDDSPEEMAREVRDALERGAIPGYGPTTDTERQVRVAVGPHVSGTP